MKPMITESDIQSIVEKSDEIMNIINKPTEIRLINESDNKVFKIEGKKPIFAKLGLTGWGKVEFQTLIMLKEKKYNVPMPITYLPVQDVLNEKSDYGNFKREVGILFYFPLEGQVLEQHLTKINIRNALNFLKKLHEDKSLINEGNINYQDVEVKRGLKYIQKLFKGELAERLQSIMIKYQDIKIDSCFIHGGPRLEHFIFKNNQMGMIDFEGACTGDPFKDLGIFFTELLFHNISEEELIKIYFNRKLSEEEKLRLQFFKLRTFLVKKKFNPSQDVIGFIKKLINYS